jgi:hypothetical protein
MATLRRRIDDLQDEAAARGGVGPDTIMATWICRLVAEVFRLNWPADHAYGEDDVRALHEYVRQHITGPDAAVIERFGDYVTAIAAGNEPDPALYFAWPPATWFRRYVVEALANLQSNGRQAPDRLTELVSALADAGQPVSEVSGVELTGEVAP